MFLSATSPNVAPLISRHTPLVRIRMTMVRKIIRMALNFWSLRFSSLCLSPFGPKFTSLFSILYVRPLATIYAQSSQAPKFTVLSLFSNNTPLSKVRASVGVNVQVLLECPSSKEEDTISVSDPSQLLQG